MVVLGSRFVGEGSAVDVFVTFKLPSVWLAVSPRVAFLQLSTGVNVGRTPAARPAVWLAYVRGYTIVPQLLLPHERELAIADGGAFPGEAIFDSAMVVEELHAGGFLGVLAVLLDVTPGLACRSVPRATSRPVWLALFGANQLSTDVQACARVFRAAYHHVAQRVLVPVQLASHRAPVGREHLILHID